MHRLSRSIVFSGCVFAFMAPDVSFSASSTPMTVAFKWCSAINSPDFVLGNVPPNTTQLAFNMVDLNVPNFMHGGGKVAYTKGMKTVACGSLDHYTRPAPPSGSHTYEWTVKALDASGQVLAEAKAKRNYPE